MRLGITFLYLLIFASLSAQVDYTANDTIIPYTGYFGYGANMGYYPPWTDDQLADIAAGNEELGIDGVGITTIRPALFGHFLENWGYDIRVSQFKHYQNLGLKDNAVIIGYPIKEQTDPNFYCEEFQSQLFANMYTDIWDNGENGTPVNDKNYYALYLYKTVIRYKDYITFYEIWNEPDFDYSNTAWKPAGFEESWWNNDPDVCGYALKAPITHYNRMLRISYEIIKKYDADSYVCIGGLGYPSFLDAVLRNTDNPKDGSVTAEYPHKGGAYFEVMSFHSYPHIDGSLRNWDDGINDFLHFRHSDAALEGVITLKNEFTNTLSKYGYQNKKYPEKLYIITECNIPRKTIGDFIGSEKAQINFLIKTLTEVQKYNVLQFHIYNLGETKDFDNADSEFSMMGLYKKLNGTKPFTQKKNNSGIAYKTTSELLHGSSYDKERTDALNFIGDVRGSAFVDPFGYYTYVLWAQTSKDRSEEASATFSFPKSLNIQNIEIKKWDFSKTNEITTTSSEDIPLTGEPIFITIEGSKKLPLDEPVPFGCYPNPSNGNHDIVFNLDKTSTVSLEIIDLSGTLVKSFYKEKILKKGTYTQTLKKDIKPNIYFCRLTIDKQSHSKKILKGIGD